VGVRNKKKFVIADASRKLKLTLSVKSGLFELTAP